MTHPILTATSLIDEALKAVADTNPTSDLGAAEILGAGTPTGLQRPADPGRAGWRVGGGLTDLDDGVLLCSHHHHRAHDLDYIVERLANGDVRFARRT